MNPLASLALLAEGSPAIGTGHVVEALSLARKLIEMGGNPAVWVNEQTPAALLDHAACRVEVVKDFGPPELKRLAHEIGGRGIRGVVTNFRSICNEQVSLLKQEALRVLCVDEWGQRHLDCDAVVNTSPVSDYHRYFSNNPGFRLYAGAAYLSLSEAFQEIHKTKRYHRGPIQSVAVAMGGVDRTGATVRIVKLLLLSQPDLDLHVVIGSGFAHRQELELALAQLPANRVHLYENLPSLADILFGCDVGFTAGGNTLAELACVGTPALVASEDLHEDEQGKAFESQGFGRWIGKGIMVSRAQIRDAFRDFDDPEMRSRHCQTGKSLVDGKGASRILDAAEKMLRDDSPIAS